MSSRTVAGVIVEIINQRSDRGTRVQDIGHLWKIFFKQEGFTTEFYTSDDSLHSSVTREFRFLESIGHIFCDQFGICTYGHIRDVTQHVPGHVLVYHNPGVFTGTGLIVSNINNTSTVLWDERCSQRVCTYNISGLNHHAIFYAPKLKQ